MHIPVDIIHQIITFGTLAKLNLAQLHNLTPHQFMALGLIASRGPVSFKQLRRALSIPMSSFTFLIDKLEEKKLVTRQRDARDRRQWVVEATGPGKKLSTEMMEKEPEMIRLMLDQLPSDQQAEIALTLNSYIEDKKIFKDVSPQA